MAECGKLSSLIIGLGVAPHEGFEIVFLQQAGENYLGTPERRWPCVWTIKEYTRRMLKKARLLNRSTVARQDAPFRRQGRSERRGEEVQTALRVGRSPLRWVLANGKAPPALPTSENLIWYVELLSDSRTPLADFFSILLRTRARISGWS
jgi:hypothetical protein